MNKNTHCLTLRIDQRLDDLLVEASYERRISKAAWIRETLRYRLGSDVVDRAAARDASAQAIRNTK